MPTKPKIRPCGWLWTKPGQPDFLTNSPPGEYDPMWKTSGYQIQPVGPKQFSNYRAVLIDPYTKTVEIHNFGFMMPVHHYILEAIEPLYGMNGMFTAVMIDDENMMYLDDNSIAANSPTFTFPPYPQLLHGKAIILGYDAEGDTTDSTCSLEAIQNRIIF